MSKVLDQFCATAPFAVMTRILIQDFLGTNMNGIFEENRQTQYDYIASFESIALAVADVALRFCENFNQSYKKHAEKLEVSVQSFYAKTRGVDPTVSEAIVAQSAKQAMAIQDALGVRPWVVIPGYRCLTVDGNVLAKSQKRLGLLRAVKGAPMPGKVVARFDVQRQIFDKAYVLLDGHAQESTCCARIVSDLKSKDVLIADRHYCIVSFMEAIAQANACFVIRQHGRLRGILLGKRKFVGRIETGTVYEQQMKLTDDEDALIVRRITLVLNESTRDGATEIHLLANLPTKISGLVLANAYRHRWEEETAFNVLQMTLNCELPSIGHPKAATFLFCMSVLAYNLRQTIFAALFAVHPEEEVIEVSHFHVSKNVSDYTPGMLVSVTPQQWNDFIPTTINGLVTLLTRIARAIPLEEFRKSKRGPKIKKTSRSRNVASSHVSTAKLLGIT